MMPYYMIPWNSPALMATYETWVSNRTMPYQEAKGLGIVKIHTEPYVMPVVVTC